MASAAETDTETEKMAPTTTTPQAEKDIASKAAAAPTAPEHEDDAAAEDSVRPASKKQAAAAGLTKAKSASPSTASVYPTGARLVLIIASLCLAVFLVALDQTIIAPALGAITAEFGSVKDIGWYGSAYLLTTTALQPTYGAIYRIFDIKYTYLAAIGVFELGSLVCALAPTSNAFIVGRAVAGLGTAGLFSGSIVILAHSLSLRRRPMAFGAIGGMWGIASVAGPLLGGAFTDHITWRWCFYINLPIGGLAMVVIFFFLHIDRKNNPEGHSLLKRITEIDLIGASILIPAIVCLILALQWGGAEYPWNDSKIIGLFVGFAGLIICFIGTQLWQGDKGMLPPRLFLNRNVLCAMLFGFFFGAAFFPLIFYLSLYFQAIQGDTAVQAGIKILPMMIAVVITSVACGGLISAVGYLNPFVLPSMLLFAVGAGMITTFSLDSPFRVWFGYQVLAGLGIGAGFQTGVLVVQTVLPLELVPIGTACVQFFQSLGGAIFIAVAQTVFQNGLIENVERDAPGINPLIFINSGANQVRQVLAAMGQTAATNAVLNAYLQGLRHAYFITVACAAAAFVVALGLDWVSLKKKKKTVDETEEEGGAAGTPEPVKEPPVFA